MGEAKRKKEHAQKQRVSSRPLTHSPADAIAVLQVANAFREISRPFCEKAGSFSPNQMKQVADKDFGGIITSATNLAFAIELYLKAFRMLKELEPMRTHDLAALYANLPKDLRRAIEAAYNATRTKAEDVSESRTVIFAHLRHKNVREEVNPFEVPTALYDSSLPAVLERSRNLFEKWRYLYDQIELGKEKLMYFEYQRLELAADALREHAMRTAQALGIRW